MSAIGEGDTNHYIVAEAGARRSGLAGMVLALTGGKAGKVPNTLFYKTFSGLLCVAPRPVAPRPLEQSEACGAALLHQDASPVPGFLLRSSGPRGASEPA